jgi:hypothetical protein
MADVTEKMAAVSERAAKVSRLKEAYQKIYNNPFRTNHSIFDPATFRYEAARAYAKDYYKYTPRSMAIPLGMIASVVVLQIFINKERTERERVIRTGESTYYERAKFASRGLY